MKRLISLILVLCMVFGMVATVSAASNSSFKRTLKIVRLVRSLWGNDKDAEEEQPVVEKEPTGKHEKPDIEAGGNILTVYVSAAGKAGADGTKANPYATIEDARDAVRAIDKAKYDGIVVLIQRGEYRINNTIAFTQEDSGTESCPITYLGEDGTILCGGVSFDYTAFKKGDGQLTQYFPEEAKDNIVVIDLKDYGFTVEQIEKLLSKKKSSFQSKAPIIAVDGKNMTMARFPNEGWISMEHGQFYDANGNPTQYTDNDKVAKELQANTTVVEYGDKYFDTVSSWHDSEDYYVEGRFTHLWVHDNSAILNISKDEDKITVPYVGAYVPNDGGLLYFYNIPEELDIPGEYIVDRDGILYYYPEENFETSRFTMAVLDVNMVDVSADYLTFDNITFESGRKTSIYGQGNNITIKNCVIRDFTKGIDLTAGYNNIIYSNEVYSIGDTAIHIEGGDKETLARSNSYVCNNHIYDWSISSVLAYAITNSGCGVTICHNECHDSDSLAMDSSGPYHLIEFNYIHDVAKFFSDGGAIGDGGSLGYGTIFRYNLIENAGTKDYPAVSQLGVQAFTVDCDASGLTIYSNIVRNVTGSGVGISGGRDHDVHNNLFISCGYWGYSLDARDMGSYRFSTEPKTKKINSLYTSEIWQKAFPELKGIHGNYNPNNILDPKFEGMPSGNRFVDNYGFFDKGNRFTTTYVTVYTFLNTDDEIINSCSEIIPLSADNGNMTTYNSRRDKTTIAEALATAKEAGYPIMTEEQFANIGRIGIGTKNVK